MFATILNNTWFLAAIWIGLAFFASLISIRLGISVALIEIIVGIIAGNFLGLHQTNEWINFLASLGSVVLTFLSGAEIDPVSLRANLKSSLTVGLLAFFLPFGGVWLFTQFVLGWDIQQAQIAGIALSTTSVAVVYAVMIETGKSNTNLGKMILAACFINDLGTVIALGVLFAGFRLYLLVFIAATAAVMFFMPRITKYIITKCGEQRVSEPEVKFIFFILFLLAGLATLAGSEAVLPAYLIGLVVAGVFVKDKTLISRMRAITFTVFTPFYFIKAGMNVSLHAVWLSFGVIAALFLMKVVCKVIGVWPAARGFGMGFKEANYTTLLMSTGLTFGTISAQFGLSHQIIGEAQYSVLVTVIILTAIIPTLIAQRFFEPSAEAMNAWGNVNSNKINGSLKRKENHHAEDTGRS
ncbi:MAG TPA: cation:proton antiporter [Clostridiales bacterium]|nr:cation:proton antiporter [Clostridiales bacterium]